MVLDIKGGAKAVVNRKKIVSLLTSLVVVSSIFTGCGSSNKGTENTNQTSTRNEDFRRTSERIVTDYNGEPFNSEGGQYPSTNYQENQYRNGSSYGNDITGIDNENGIMSGIGGDETGTEYVVPYNMLPQDNISDSNMNSEDMPMDIFEGSYSKNDDNNQTINNFNDQYDMEEEKRSFGSNMILEDLDPEDMSVNDFANANENAGMGYREAEVNTNIGAGGSTSFSNDTNVNNDSYIDHQQDYASQVESEKYVREAEAQSGVALEDEEQEVEEETVKVIGKFIPVRSIGGVELSGGVGKKNPQGTIQVSFTLSGDVLNEMVGTSDEKDEGKQTQERLGDVILRAYEEAIVDHNKGYAGQPILTEREKLQSALKRLIVGEDDKKISDNKIILRDSNNNKVYVPITKDLVPASSVTRNYVRHIIDIDGMKQKGIPITSKTIADQIAVSLILRSNNTTMPDKLETNTTYEFIGIDSKNKDNNFPLAGNKSLTGFNMETCTTGKAPSSIEANVESDARTSTSAIKEAENFDSSPGEAVSGTVYTTLFTNKMFIDMTTYDISKEANVKSYGTSIKFSNIIFKDPDESIADVFMEDNQGKKYFCNLVDVSPSDNAKGKCVEVTGLRPQTPYVFKNIRVVTNTSGKEEENVIQLMESQVGAAAAASQRNTGKVVPNTKSVTTAAFKAPEIKLGGNDNKGSSTLELPGGLKVPVVNNDMTALRYILKVDNSNGNIGDMSVTGLKGDEKYSVQKFSNKHSGTNYYIVTLRNLSPNTDYGFLTLELNYKDFDNNSGVSRISLANLNSKSDSTYSDNSTEKSVREDKEVFTVSIVSTFNTKYGRTAIVPMFIDDMNGMFKDISVIPLNSNPNINVTYDGENLRVSGLNPNSNENVAFTVNYKRPDGNEGQIKRVLLIKTPLAGEVDIKNDVATVSGGEASIKLEYGTGPKTDITSVVVKPPEGKELDATWDAASSTITIKKLEEGKEYRNLIATFTLKNSNKVSYPLTTFTTSDTKPEEDKPTGKIANFVERVYTIALGRQPEVTGWKFWIRKLESKEISATTFIAENLMTQKEFIERELNKSQFVTTMYSLIVSRQPDAEGQSYWERKYEEYRDVTTSIADLRIKIAREMMNEPEFKELVTSLGLDY